MDWLGDNLWAMWLAIAALLLIGEMASLDLVMLMLAFGAGAAALSSIWIDQWPYQLLIGVVVAVACIGLVRPGVLHRLHAGPDLKVGPERMVGVTLTSPVPLNADSPTQVKFDGSWWGTQLVAGHAPLEAGSIVEVVKVTGATVFVAPTTEKE